MSNHGLHRVKASLPSAEKPSADLADPTPTVRVVTAIDCRYLPFAAALVITLSENRAESTQIELTILHVGDITVEDQRRLARTGTNLDLRYRTITADLYARCGLRLTGLLAQPQYFRCMVPDVLPQSVSRAIYLDADTLVLDDLSDLHGVDMQGAPVAAIQDWLPTVRDAIAPWRHLQLDGDAPYFNSGVLVMDLEQWRKEDAGRIALEHCLRGKKHLAARGRWMQHDQYGLNIVFHRRWLQLPATWNHFSELAPRCPRIVHLVGNGKPWNPKCHPHFVDAFYSAVDRTEWAGWRTPPRDRTPGTIGSSRT